MVRQRLRSVLALLLLFTATTVLLISFSPSVAQSSPPTEPSAPKPPKPHRQRSLNTYPPWDYWSQEGSRVWFRPSANATRYLFDMPDDYRLADTHVDLLWLAHYILCPWDDTIKRTKRRGDRKPRPGSRPGLAFSGGFDAASAMVLMPNTTALVYLRRTGFDSTMYHANPEMLFDEMARLGRPVLQVPTNSELLRHDHWPLQHPGFTSDYHMMVPLLLMADHLNLDSIGSGMSLETTYRHSGRYRVFDESAHFKQWKVFDTILPFYNPVSGISEVANMAIARQAGLTNHINSCLRSPIKGKGCGKCYKCFRKNGLLGRGFTKLTELLSPTVTDTLSHLPLKTAFASIYGIQRSPLRGFIEKLYPHLVPFLQYNVEGPCLRYYPRPNRFIPQKYQEYHRNALAQYIEPMTAEDIHSVETLKCF